MVGQGEEGPVQQWEEMKVINLQGRMVTEKVLQIM